MSSESLAVCLVTQVFPEPRDWERLPGALSEARAMGAELALLPEIPLNPWVPASPVPRDRDAEDPDGPRQQALSRAAATAGLAVLGGAIIRDPETGIRHNTALLYDGEGHCRARYRKIHLPAEEGYWESSHYEPGGDPPVVVPGLPLRIGIQICSDVNRPTGGQLLAAQGTEVILVPRCTPPQTWERWKLVLRANAVMSSCWVLSANRPAPTLDGLVGGPSVAIAPDGKVLVETTEPLEVVTLTRESVEASRLGYPGYLKRFPELYARGWEGAAGAE